MAESLHPNVIEDSFKYLFKLMISALAFSHNVERPLYDFIYSSSNLILLNELLF
jgi:hypothetical protein